MLIGSCPAALLVFTNPRPSSNESGVSFVYVATGVHGLPGCFADLIGPGPVTREHLSRFARDGSTATSFRF